MEFQDEEDTRGARPIQPLPPPIKMAVRARPRMNEAMLSGFWQGVGWGINDALHKPWVWALAILGAIIVLLVTHG